MTNQYNVHEQVELDFETMHRANAIGASAEHLAVFLKSLPEDVDNFKLLNIIADFVGADLGIETMRVLLGAPRSTGKYILMPMNSRAGLEKIPVIKAIREVLGSGLKEAKDCAEGTVGLSMTSAEVFRLNQAANQLGYQVRSAYSATR